MRVRKNRCYISGHGRLTGNSQGGAKKVTKSICREPMVVETSLTLKMTARLDSAGVCKQIIPIQQPQVLQKCIFLIFGDLIWQNFDIFHI